MHISISKGKFIYKMFDKQDACYYYIVTVLLITSNITSVIVYSSTVTEFVRIARLILLLKGYLRYKTILCHKVALDV